MFFDNIDFSSLELPPAALKLRDEVRAFLIERGLPAYLDWITAETNASRD